MRILLLITIVFLLGILSCKKTDNRQFSYWYLNQDCFRTNDVRTEKGKATHQLFTSSFTNGFFIRFNLGHFPTAGTYKLDCSLQNPSWACFGIIYRDTGYLPNSLNNYMLTATEKMARLVIRSYRHGFINPGEKEIAFL